jgi:hypothetical protein
MQFPALGIWCFISALILLVPLTRCMHHPRPVCNAALGEKLNATHCNHALEFFQNYVNTLLGISNSTHLTTIQKSKIRDKIYHFSNGPRATHTPKGLNLVYLPLTFSHQGCTVLIDMPMPATARVVRASWGNISYAIRYIFRQCIVRPSPIGGTVIYHDLATSIGQFQQLADTQGLDPAQFYDLIDQLEA